MAFFIFLMMFGYRLAHEVPEDNFAATLISWVICAVGFFGVNWLYDSLKEKI